MVAKLSLVVRPKEIHYLKINPAVGLAGAKNVAVALIDKTITPAARLEVFFVHGADSEPQVLFFSQLSRKFMLPQQATVIGVGKGHIVIETPSLPRGTAQTYLQDGEKQIDGPPEETKYSFTPKLKAAADLVWPQKSDPGDSAEPVSVEKGTLTQNA